MTTHTQAQAQAQAHTYTPTPTPEPALTPEPAPTPTLTRAPVLILIGGHWLGAWAWDNVLAALPNGAETAAAPAAAVDAAPTAQGAPAAQGSPTAIAMTLPGFDPEDSLRTTRSLEDQARAILALMSKHDGRPVVLVAHSGANAPVSMVLDRSPERVARMVWVDSGPVAPGTVFAPDFPELESESSLPPFEALAQYASIEGLNPAVLGRFRSRAVPVPGPVLRQPVTLSNDARRDVPTTMICCSLPSAQLRELASAGHPMFAETSQLTRAEFLDLPTGHWPMWSEPERLAQLLRAEAERLG